MFRYKLTTAMCSAVCLLGMSPDLSAHAAMWAFNYTDALETFVVPTTGVYDITAYGAEGGGIYGGLGAEIGGAVTLSAGTSLTILVGGGGADGGGIANGSGGGGGSFIVVGVLGPLVVAGGGGGTGGGLGGGIGGGGGVANGGGLGGGIDGGTGGSGGGGGGGGGFVSNGVGILFGYSYLQGGSGGSGSGGGGGGGFGGGGGGFYGGGGGGGSYLDPSATLLIALGSVNSGNGQVDISTTIPEPSTWAMMLLGSAGLGFVGYRRAKAGRATLAA